MHISAVVCNACWMLRMLLAELIMDHHPQSAFHFVYEITEQLFGHPIDLHVQEPLNRPLCVAAFDHINISYSVSYPPWPQRYTWVHALLLPIGPLRSPIVGLYVVYVPSAEIRWHVVYAKSTRPLQRTLRVK